MCCKQIRWKAGKVLCEKYIIYFAKYILFIKEYKPNIHVQGRLKVQTSKLILNCIILQQIRALLQHVGTSFCPNFVDWFGREGTNSHSRIADRSILAKFLQSNPSDFSTTKFQVQLLSIYLDDCRAMNYIKFLHAFL